MSTFLQFALLGLGAGSTYAIAGVGLTQVYRSSGVLNLAHGAIAFVSAVVFVEAWQSWSWPAPLAVVLAVGVAAVIGALIELLVMNPLRHAAPLVRMIATLGVLAILLQSVPLVFGTDFQRVTVGSFYPAGSWAPINGVTVTYDRLIVLGIAISLATVLGIAMKRTRFGLATTAVAESQLVASTIGVDSRRVALGNWVLGSALAGLAGVLLIPIIGVVAAAPLVLLVIPALAASLIGRFSSFPLTVVGGVGIGIGQSLLTRYQSDLFPDNLAVGWPDALPFIVVVVLLVVTGSPFPERGEQFDRLPRVGSRSVAPLSAVFLAVVGVGLTMQMSARLAGAVTATAGLALIGLSLVVVIGLVGQVSLAQTAIAGLGALMAARLSEAWALPFPVLVVAAICAGALASLLVTLPAMRTRGPTLAIATLGVGIAIERVVLNNGDITRGGFSGTPIARPTLLGIDINAIEYPQRYAAMCVVAVVVASYVVASLRSGPAGRQLLAVRSSQRAASGVGISLAASKIGAFAVAGGLAAVGGVLLSFRADTVTYSQFGLLPSFNHIVYSIIGGIGFVLGPIIGSALAPTGLASSLVDGIESAERWVILGTGVGLIVILIVYPDGIVAAFADRAGRRRPPRQMRLGEGPVTAASIRNQTLEVDGLTVRYGGSTVLADFAVTVSPGEIVGLVGPNGAGKTTAIDSISGFTRTSSGRVLLGGEDLTGKAVHTRARAGMARTFQTVEPFDDLTVGENLAVSVAHVRWWDWVKSLVRRQTLELPKWLAVEATAFGLDRLDSYPDELSQGRRRLMGVLRALAGNPSIVLLDEPAAGLDSAETEHLGQLLRQVADDRNVGMLLVDHDVQLIASVCDRVVALDFGAIVFDGPAADAFEDRRVRASYLGEELVT